MKTTDLSLVTPLVPSIQNLSEYLDESARQAPDRVAVVDPNGSTLTYGALSQRADWVQELLSQLEVHPGERIALVLRKSLSAVVVAFGILKAGAICVPIDHTAPPEYITSALTDCQVALAFVHGQVYAGEGVSSFRAVLVGSEESNGPDLKVLPNSSDHSLRHDVVGSVHKRDVDQTAYILYTSGSTGAPKGVTLTHRNMISFVEWCAETFTPLPTDRFSSHAPFHFDLSILDIYLAIRCGASVHLIAEQEAGNPGLLVRFISARRLTIWYSTPAILGLIADSPEIALSDVSCLRCVLFAGEVFPVKKLRRLTNVVPSATYFNLYGPTETNVCLWYQVATPIPEDRDEPFPIGWPCSHCETLVLKQGGDVAQDGDEGVLYIAGPSVFSGYWNRAAETTKAFVARGGTRWYNTGDIVRRLPDSCLTYLGRRDRMIKRRGYRIELDHIEHCLYKHDSIDSVAVIAHHSAGDVRIVAYLVMGVTPPPSQIDLRLFCAKYLPTYMTPDAFVAVAGLPRTSTNKVDYERVRRDYCWPADLRVPARDPTGGVQG